MQDSAPGPVCHVCHVYVQLFVMMLDIAQMPLMHATGPGAMHNSGHIIWTLEQSFSQLERLKSQSFLFMGVIAHVAQ